MGRLDTWLTLQQASLAVDTLLCILWDWEITQLPLHPALERAQNHLYIIPLARTNHEDTLTQGREKQTPTLHGQIAKGGEEPPIFLLSVSVHVLIHTIPISPNAKGTQLLHSPTGRPHFHHPTECSVPRPRWDSSCSGLLSVQKERCLCPQKKRREYPCDIWDRVGDSTDHKKVDKMDFLNPSNFCSSKGTFRKK